MQSNWSLILNVLLLVVVVVAISRMIKSRRQDMVFSSSAPSPSLGKTEANYDDIIAVRKITNEKIEQGPTIRATVQPTIQPIQPAIQPTLQPTVKPVTLPKVSVTTISEEKKPAPAVKAEKPISLMIFLLAKENKQLAGYDLLQTVLAAGLRFGEGHLFHRHQQPNGQGPVLCSLAAATPTGVFDLQNIGAFSVHGLCLFMHASGDTTLDRERLMVMLDTAKQLSENLNTHLLDDKRQPLSEESVKRYSQLLNIEAK